MPSPEEIIGGAGIISTGINAIAQSAANRKAREFQLDMYNRQRGDALADWQMQNEYNSPLQQMERLKAAGLNPNLVYGNGATATSSQGVRASQSGSYTPKAPQIDFAGIASGVLQARMQNVQIGNLEKQREIMEEEKRLKAIQSLSLLTGIDKTKLGIESGKFDLAMRQTLASATLEGALLKNEDLKRSIGQKEASTQFTLDENERKQVMMKGNLELQLQHILTLKKGREEADARIENMKKEGLIRDFEIKLNKLGLTKNDPYYYRVLSSFLEDPKKALDKVKEEVRKANPLDGSNWQDSTVNPGFQQIF